MKSTLILIVLCVSSVFAASANATDVSLTNRSFYQARKARTALQPWPELSGLKLEKAGEDLQKLYQWILDRRNNLLYWPPRFSSDDEVKGYIHDWQMFRQVYSKNKTKLQSDPNLILLGATYLLYGYNLDEDGASKELEAFLKAIPASSSSHDLALALTLLFDVRTPTRGDFAKSLEELAQHSPSSRFASLLYLGAASRCIQTFKTHRAMRYLALAKEKSFDEIKPYRELFEMPGINFSLGVDIPDKEVPFNNLYYTSDGLLGSTEFGFETHLPNGWRVTQGSNLQMQNLTSVAGVSIPKLSSGLEHGLTISSEIVAGKFKDKTESFFLSQFKKQNLQFTDATNQFRAPPGFKVLVTHTHSPVGKNGDTISMIVAYRKIDPVRFSMKDHLVLAQKEPSCDQELPNANGKVQFMAKRNRYNAPILLTFVYSGSKGTFDIAKNGLNSILSTLKVNEFSGTNVKW